MATYTYDQLWQMYLVAQTDAERLAIRQELIANAREHPADQAPLISVTDMGEPMLPQLFHRRWIDAIREYRRLLLLAPRGHAKSEWMSGQFALHEIGRDPRIRILLVSSDDDQAAMHTRRISQLIDTAAYRVIWTSLPALDECSKLQLRLDVPGAHTTWRGEGIKSIGPGPRADLIILDDVVSLKNSRTPTLRQEIISTYNTVIRGMLHPVKGRVLAVGTPYYQGDLYEYLAGLVDVQGRSIYQVIRESALYRDGLPQHSDDFSPGVTPLWPDRFTVEALQQVRQEIGELDFGSQYLCTILTATGDVFSRGMFLPISREELPQLVEVWLISDTATSTSNEADAMILMTIGRDAESNVYLLETVKGKWAPLQAKQLLVDTLKACRALFKRTFRGLAFEDTKENYVFGAWISEDRTLGHPTIVKNGGLSKYERARCILPTLENAPVYFVRAPWNGPLLDVLCSFKKEGSRMPDDEVDTLVVGCAQLWKIRFTRDLKPPPGRSIQLLPTL